MLTKFYDDSKRPLSLHVFDAAVELVRIGQHVDFGGDDHCAEESGPIFFSVAARRTLHFQRTKSDFHCHPIRLRHCDRYIPMSFARFSVGRTRRPVS
jgi:hypothetical protein